MAPSAFEIERVTTDDKDLVLFWVFEFGVCFRAHPECLRNSDAMHCPAGNLGLSKPVSRERFAYY